MEQKNKIYTAADFARYHSGTMPPGEMHELEKAALEDPFLQDALEGYIHSGTVHRDIEELQNRLAAKERKKNKFFISSYAQSKWWRVAALIIIMAGSVYFFYRPDTRPKQNSLAKNETEVVTKQTDSANADIKKTETDSTHGGNDIALENRSNSKLVHNEKQLYPGGNRRIEKRTVGALPRTESSPATSSEQLNESFYKDSTYNGKPYHENDTTVMNEYVLKGKVTDEDGGPVPFAKVTAKDGMLKTVTDKSGQFMLHSKDSNITATAAATGYQAKTFSLKKDIQHTITMSKANAALIKVVVTSRGKTKQSKKEASEDEYPDDKIAEIKTATPGPQPSDGQQNFDKYLKENTPSLYDENNESLTGEVSLSFLVNKKGRPEDIKVVNSSCKPCEKQAIKLLENGPDWSAGKNKSGTVLIKF